MTRYQIPETAHTPVRIDVQKINIHTQERIQINVGGHTKLILTTDDASKLAWQIWDAIGKRGN